MYFACFIFIDGLWGVCGDRAWSFVFLTDSIWNTWITFQLSDNHTYYVVRYTSLQPGAWVEGGGGSVHLDLTVKETRRNVTSLECKIEFSEPTLILAFFLGLFPECTVHAISLMGLFIFLWSTNFLIVECCLYINAPGYCRSCRLSMLYNSYFLHKFTWMHNLVL